MPKPGTADSDVNPLAPQATPETSFNADVVDARKDDLTPCSVETDTHKFVVQTNPNLIISTEKETGEEVHHSDPETVADIWAKIKDFVAKEIQTLETKNVDNDDAA